MPTANWGIDYFNPTDQVSRANFNALLDEVDSKGAKVAHNHSGGIEGGSSLGPLVKADLTDAVAPVAPGSGLTRLYTVSSRVGYRSGAAGTAKVLADQDTIETLSNKTLATPVITGTVSGSAVGTGAGQIAPGNHTHAGLQESAIKLAPESTGATASLHDDGDLVIALAANEVVSFEAVLEYTNGAATGHAQIAFTVPSGASLMWSAVGVDTSDAVQIVHETVSGTGHVFGNPSASTRTIHVRGTVRNGVTAGALQLQWAESVAVGGLTMEAGSDLVVTRH